MTDLELAWQINTLNAAYVRTIDSDALEAWPDYFTADCLYNITSDDNYRKGLEAGIFYADSRGMLKDRISALRQANIFEGHRYRHMLGMSAVLSHDSSESHTQTRAETPFATYRIMRDGRTDLFVTGRYVDRIVHDDTGLRFAERIVVCDSSVFDTLLVIPL
jgi:3-phenylpropionate/cinnamic acid dioxygenase small subunit